MFISIVTALVTARLYPEATSPSLIALAINYTLLIPIYLNWVVKLGADLEMYIGAVERISLYINSNDNSTSYSDIDGSPCADDLMAIKPTEKCKYLCVCATEWGCARACVIFHAYHCVFVCHDNPNRIDRFIWGAFWHSNLAEFPSLTVCMSVCPLQLYTLQFI